MIWLWRSSSILFLVFFLFGCASNTPEPIYAERNHAILGSYLISEEPEPEIPRIITVEEPPETLSDDIVLKYLIKELMEVQRRYYAVLYYVITNDATLLLEELR